MLAATKLRPWAWKGTLRTTQAVQASSQSRRHFSRQAQRYAAELRWTKIDAEISEDQCNGVATSAKGAKCFLGNFCAEMDARKKGGGRWGTKVSYYIHSHQISRGYFRHLPARAIGYVDPENPTSHSDDHLQRTTTAFSPPWHEHSFHVELTINTALLP